MPKSFSCRCPCALSRRRKIQRGGSIALCASSPDAGPKFEPKRGRWYIKPLRIIPAAPGLKALINPHGTTPGPRRRYGGGRILKEVWSGS
jgi:hypothetical protein